MKTDWNGILEFNEQATVDFAQGQVSGDEFYGHFTHTPVGGEVRSLLRNHGVAYARRLSRKALRRRNVIA